MKNNPDFEIGDFIFRFFRKHAASFQANICKASITGNPKDIHRARLDVKKIFAIFDLLRILRPKTEKDPEYEKLFKKLYKASGRLREVQINLLLLTGDEFTGYDLEPFTAYLREQERESTADFLDLVRKFDEDELIWVEKRIKKEIGRITPAILHKKTNRYIHDKTAWIMYLIDNGDDEKKLHRIRQQMKELGTVLSIVTSVRPAGQVEKVISGLNKTEMLIGDWHDRVILAGSMEIFIDQAKTPEPSSLAPVRDCYLWLSGANGQLFEKMTREARAFINPGPPSVLHSAE